MTEACPNIFGENMKLSLEIHKDSAIPIYSQMEEQIRLLIHRGVLKPGDPMPTVRELAVDLCINLNTVARVYRDLQNADALTLKRGIGTFVAENPVNQAIHESEFKAIEKKVRELVAKCQHTNMTSAQLFQFIERIWKEEQNETNSI